MRLGRISSLILWRFSPLLKKDDRFCLSFASFFEEDITKSLSVEKEGLSEVVLRTCSEALEVSFCGGIHIHTTEVRLSWCTYRQMQNLMTEKACALLCKDSNMMEIPYHPEDVGVPPEQARLVYREGKKKVKKLPEGLLPSQVLSRSPCFCL